MMTYHYQAHDQLQALTVYGDVFTHRTMELLPWPTYLID